MAFCSQCGSAMADAARFCPGCGSPSLEDHQPQPATPVSNVAATKRQSNTFRIILAAVTLFVLLGGAWLRDYMTQHPVDFGSGGNDAAGQSGASNGPDVLSKGDEMSRAHAGARAIQVEGNANKWEGTYVRFPCKIMNVIDLGGGVHGANAMCGAGVTASYNASQPNVDYTDPDAVNKAVEQAQQQAEHFMQQSQDQALLVLVGDKTAVFDGGQIVTITGPVLGTIEGKNAMGATLNYPAVRVDYAE